MLPWQGIAVAADQAATAPAGNAGSWRVKPGPDDGSIAYWAARLLEDSHYSMRRFDKEVSSQFLDRYIDTLDSQHLYFLQSDLAQFERYRTNLETLTITPARSADVTPAFEIFSRFYERVQQRVNWADEYLKTGEFNFDTDERITVDRRDAPFPKDLAEAKELWRQRLRYEYLLEKMALDAKKAKAGATNAGTSGSGETFSENRIDPSRLVEPGRITYQWHVNTNGSVRPDDAASATANSNSTDSKPEPPKSTHEQIVDTLTHRYHRILRIYTDWNNEDVLGFYLTALARVYDPHSDYFNRAMLDGFRISMNLQLFGIGAQLRSEEGNCRIESLLPGGPAIKSQQIKPGDSIVAVAQSNQPPVDVVDMHLTKVVQLIRGPKGTEVRLTIVPEGSSERKVVTLIRDEIPLEDSAAKGKIIELPDAKGGSVKLGVIDLPSFYAPMLAEEPRKDSNTKTNKGSSGYTSVDVAKLLKKFKEEKVSGVILDLRANGGGSLEEAIKLTGLFIKDGPVVQAREMNRLQVYRDTDPTQVYDGPLLVLTSRFSASASEIVAAALQDYGRALVVGDSSTHGKGTVQTISHLSTLLQLPDQDRLGALKYTIRKFYRATGVSTQLKGVRPDIVLPSKWNYAKEIGESALENPLPQDHTQPARFEKLNLVQPYLAELLKRSSERIATNQDFAYVHEDIERFRKDQEDKTVSLSEKELVRQRAENEARQKAREKELRSRPEPKEKVYEITLKQAELPGLPPPVQRTNSLAWAATPGGGVVGTNSASNAQTAPPKPLNGDSESDEGPVPAVDVGLSEAQRILLDYIQLRSVGAPERDGLVVRPSA